MDHSVRLLTFQVIVESCVNPVPPSGASQPIPSISVADVLQLTETGSPNLTTTSAGVSIRWQSANQKHQYSIRALFGLTTDIRMK